MIGASLATRYGSNGSYRNNGFLELVCVCGTDAAVLSGHGARSARANSVSYVIVTHF